MKWITHQTAGVGAALALHLPLEGVVAACLGAILPDKLDQAIAKRSRNPQRTFNQIHRGTTHWFGWWVAILLLACSHLVPPHWQPALLGIGLGGISHVVLDMLTPSGIPLHPFSRKNKLSFKVCSTDVYKRQSLDGAALLAAEPWRLPALARWCATATLVPVAEDPGFHADYLRHMRFGV